MAPTYSSASFGDYGRKPIQSAQAELINAAELEHDASLFAGRANSFTCPLGDTPGYGYLLMQRKHVLELHQEFLDQGNTALEKDLQIGIDWIFVDALAAIRPKWITLQHLILVNATRVYPGYEEDENSIMLVEVADVRYWLKKSFIDTQYNVRCITETDETKYWTPSLKVDEEHIAANDDPDDPDDDVPVCQEGCRPWTWREVLQDIWEHFPEEYQDLVPELPVLYDNLWDAIPERLTFNCMSALTAYCETLRLAGGAMLGYDPIQHEFRIVIPGGLNTDTDFATLKTSYRQSLYKKQEVLNNSPAFIPEKIRVVFEAVYDTREVEEFFLRPKYTIEIPFANYLRDAGMSDSIVFRAKEGTVEIINAKKDAFITGIDPTDCVCPELPPEPEDPEEPGFLHPQNLDRLPEPDNYTDLEECAKDLAYRFWDYRITDEPTELVYEGCLPFRHGDKVFQVTWRNIDHKGWQTILEYHRALKGFFDSVTAPSRELRSQAGCDPAVDEVCNQLPENMNILTERIGNYSGLPSSLNNYVPAYWEFDIPDGIHDPIDAVDSTADTLESPALLEEGEVIELDVTTGSLPAPLAINTSYYVTNIDGSSFQLSTTFGGAIIDLTDNGSGEMVIKRSGGRVFRVWFRRDTPTGEPYILRAISDQFSVKYKGFYRKAHFEFHVIYSGSPFPPRIRLMLDDNPLKHSTGATAVAHFYYDTNFPSAFDHVAKFDLRYIDRITPYLQNQYPWEDDGSPFSSFPSILCVTPRKYPTIFESTPPLAQLWGGSPPATLNVSLNGGAPTVLHYVYADGYGKLDCYGGQLITSTSISAVPSRYGVRFVMNGPTLDIRKIMITNMGATGTSSVNNPSRVYVVDFSSPLDVTIIDEDSNSLRVYE